MKERRFKAAPAPPPGKGALGCLCAAVVPMACVAGWFMFASLSLRDATGSRGAWVRTHLSEWGTGRGGYYVNETHADRLLMSGVAVAAALLTGLFAWLRPKSRAGFCLGLAALAGLWSSLLPIEAMIRDHQGYHSDPGYPRPSVVIPDALAGHAGQVTSVAFSPDGRLLASGGEDKTVRLWDAGRDSEVAVLAENEAEVLTVAFSPDGRLLASGGNDRSIRLWEVATRRPVSVLRGHENFVRSVIFSPDGALLASASWDKTVRLWDVQTRTQAALLEGHTDVVKAVAFSPDGEVLASGGVDGSIRLWQVSSGDLLRKLPGSCPILSLAYSPDGRWLAAAGEGMGAQAWDTWTYDDPVSLNIGETAWGVAFSPDGRRLATCTELGVVEVWKVTGGGIFMPSLSGFVRGRFVNGLAELLFEGTDILRCPGRVYGVAFSSDGRTLATAGAGVENGPRVMGEMVPRGGIPEAGPLSLWELK